MLRLVQNERLRAADLVLTKLRLACTTPLKFVQTLKEGREYIFPDAFADWQRKEQRAPSVEIMQFRLLTVSDLPNARRVQCRRAD